MNVLSLFDGISCGRVALDRAGIKVNNYYASEIDKSAIKVTMQNYPKTIQVGDVSKLTSNMFPKIDLLIGGSPCQGFSRQGLHLNFKDSRSKLFFEYVRLLKELNPKYFLLENVKMKKEYQDIISDYLKIQPIEINSKLVSAQNRPRLYWTNIQNLKQPDNKEILLKDILENIDVANYIVKDGIKFQQGISDNSIRLVNVNNGETRITQAVKSGYIVANNGDGINLSFPLSKSRRGRVIKQKSSTLDCACNLCVYINGTIRRYAINELEKLQTLPKDYTAGISDRNRIKCIGNGWTVDVISHILKNIKE